MTVRRGGEIGLKLRRSKWPGSRLPEYNQRPLVEMTTFKPTRFHRRVGERIEPVTVAGVWRQNPFYHRAAKSNRGDAWPNGLQSLECAGAGDGQRDTEVSRREAMLAV